MSKEYQIYKEEEGNDWICEVYLGDKLVHRGYGHEPELALKKAIMYDDSEEE